MGWGIGTAVCVGMALALAMTGPEAALAQTPGAAPAGCAANGAPQKATKAFVEAYSAATSNLRRRDFAAAASSADMAAVAATSGSEKLAVENIQFAAYVGLRDKAHATAALQAMKDSGCASPKTIEHGQATIDRLDQPN
jgi:hypothetical protein